VSRVDPLEALGLSLASGATEIHLVRHADAVPDEDAAGAAYDAYDLHALSARGRAQAEATAERFAALGIVAVYASPIRRALETALAIAARTGIGDVATERDLREVEIGTLEAGEMTMRARLEQLAIIAIRDGSWDAIAGTEPSAAVRARMSGALDAIAARHAGERVVAVSHAGAINAYLGTVAGTPHDFVFPLANASVSVVRVGAGRRLLMSANETAHLRVEARAR
jgi:probable phosphoglycerate mutase